MNDIKLIFLGTGTSYGIPVIGCTCPVCVSESPYNHRMRSSVLIEYNDKNILIDTSPDLRMQCLIHKINRIDAILFTHNHADHLFGLDDIRIFNRIYQNKTPCFGNKNTTDMIYRNFDYIFKPPPLSSGGIPQIDLNTINGNFELFGRTVIPIPVLHGKLPILGFRIGTFAYITDCSTIPQTSMVLLENLTILILNGLRYKPHIAHFSIKEALAVIKKLNPQNAYLTHISHDVDHNNLKIELPNNVSLAYDGLSICI